MGGRVDDVLQWNVRHAAGKVLGADRAVVRGLRPEVAILGVQIVQPGGQHAILQKGRNFLAPTVGGGALSLP